MKGSKSLSVLLLFVAIRASQGCSDTACLYFADSENIKSIRINNHSHVTTVASGLLDSTAVAVHVQGNTVYWSDNERHAILRKNLSSAEIEYLVTYDLGEVEGLAVEWESELIYWTDYIYERIEVANLDGSSRKTLIWDDLANPRALVLDPRYGVMFWADWGWTSPKIEKADLSGGNRQIIRDLTWDWHFYALGLTVDYRYNRLYWLDALFQEIYSIDYDGNNLQVEHIVGPNIQPHSIAFLDDIVYWSEWNTHSIERLNISKEPPRHLANMGWLSYNRVKGMAVFHSSVQPEGRNECRIDKGGCSYLCLLTPNGSSCDCPNGFTKNGTTCISDNVTSTSIPLPAVEVRLGGNSAHEGRVEIRPPWNNTWGTICDDHWGEREAAVVCAMLGYHGPARAVTSLTPGSGPIYLDNVKCRGHEVSIAHCKHQGWGINNCVHLEDAAVVCSNASAPTPTPTPGSNATQGPPPEIKIRLRNGHRSYEGRVEIYYDGQWGTVCGNNNNWNIKAADVVCRMLGYEGAASAQCCNWFGSGYGEVWLDQVDCIGNESSISHCRHGGWGNNACQHYNDVGVTCKFTPLPYNGSIVRLNDELRPGTGRVELFQNHEWGTICDDHWDIRDADVACQMLHYPSAVKALDGYMISAGNGRIWLDDVMCLGNETSLLECGYVGWENTDCSHGEDAGVVCQTEAPRLDSNNFLLYSEYDLGILHHLSLDLQSANDTLLSLSGVERPLSICYNSEDEFMYWSEESGNIHRSKLNGSLFETIAMGLNNPTAIAVDGPSGKIYWTENKANAITVARTSGLYPKVVVRTDQPQAIALDIAGGFLYWSSSSFVPVIGRVQMDGENQTILANLSYFSTPTALSLDRQNNRLYWVSGIFDEIRYLDLITNVEFLLRDDLQSPVGLTLYRGDLYWSSGGSGEWTGGIYKASATAVNSVTKVVSFLSHPTGIYAHDSNATEANSACKVNYGGCSNLCLLNPQGRICACPDDMQLVSDNMCTFKDILIFSDASQGNIYQVVPDAEDVQATMRTLSFSNHNNPFDIAFDPKEQVLYWTDVGHDWIVRASLDGAFQQVIIEKDLTWPAGLAIDSVGRNVYWTDAIQGTIEVARLDGSNRALLFDVSPMQPVGVVVDATRGFMYWSEWGYNNKIERAKMDGTDREDVYVWYSYYGGPNGMVLDVKANRLFWLGEHDNSIMFTDVDHLGGVAHSLIPYSIYLLWPHDIAIDINYIYWIDTLSDVLARADRKTGQNTKLLVTGLSAPRGLLRVSANERTGGPFAVGESVYVLNITGIRYLRGSIAAITSQYVFVNLDDGRIVQVVPNDTKRIFPDRTPKVHEVLEGTELLASLSSGVDFFLYGSVLNVSLNMIKPYHVRFENGSSKWVTLRDLRAPPAKHPCEVSNGGCSHLCLVRPEGMYACICPTNLLGEVCNDTRPTLRPPPTYPTVAPSPTPAPSNESSGCHRMPCLYYAAGTMIGAIDLESNNMNGSIPVVSNLLGATAVAVHVGERKLFWSDTELWVIRSIELNSGKIEDLITEDLGEVLGLDVDWASGMMYWTDFIYGRVEVARLDGSYRKTLFYEDLYNPRGIAVDPVNGIMVWVDWGLPDPKLEMASLSGETRTTLLSYSWGDWIFHPTGLVMDFIEGKVYWVDAGVDIVYSITYNGNAGLLKFFEKDSNAYDLALFRDTLYLSDLHTRSIERLNKTSGEHYLNFGWLGYEKVKGIAIMDPSRQPQGLQFCQIQNGGCSHSCLLSVTGPVCACPNGVELEDDKKTCKNESTLPTTPPVPGLGIRLAGGNSTSEGRVEINYNGQWGTICDDHWGIEEADVVCRMLRFARALRAVDNEMQESGYGEGTGPILMDDVKCRGDEATIAQCHHRGWRASNCDHSEDAGVVCLNTSLPTPTPNPSPGPAPNVTARIRDGLKSNEGRVEIFHNGEWGTICDNDWDIMDADVICRMVGFEEAWSTECCAYHGPGKGKIWLDQVNCIGDESSISQCRHGGWSNHQCTHWNDVGVTCKYVPPSPDKHVRLVDGIRPGEGRVEVFHDNYWGTICDDFWDINDADVVCRELNFSRALSAPRTAAFGQGNGHIWFDNVHCTGNESFIVNCTNNGWGEHNCLHIEDASVICDIGQPTLHDHQDIMVFLDNPRELLYLAPLEEGPDDKLEEIQLPIRNVNNPLRLDMDPRDDTIYWSQGNLQYSEWGYHQYPRLYSSYLNGTNQRLIFQDFQADDFALDYVGENIYWTDPIKEGIFVGSLKNSFQATLIRGVIANAITLDVHKGYMYWISHSRRPDGYESSVLEQSHMDGSMRKFIANLTGTSEVNSLTYDPGSNSVYWIDKENKVIGYLEVDDPIPKKLVENHLQEPYGVAVYGEHVYWSDGGTGAWSGGIYRAFRNNGSGIVKVIDLLGKPFDLYIRNRSLSNAGVSSDCIVQNGGCTQLCIPTPNGHSCVCEDARTLDKDNKTCILGDVLVFADQYQQGLYVFPLNSNGAAESPLSVNASEPLAVVIDPLQRFVYWSDAYEEHIVRAPLDGGSQEVVVNNVGYCKGLALDPIGKVLYWGNTYEKTIEVSQLDGSYRMELIQVSGGIPGDVALDISRGYMYWTTEGEYWWDDHSIVMAEMDGSNEKTLHFYSGLWYYYAPNSLTVDMEANRLYWLGYHDAVVEYIDLDKNGVIETLLYHFDYLWEPFGIAVDLDYLYWTDASMGVVARADKRTGGNLTLLASNLWHPRGIDVYYQHIRVPDNNTCGINNGHCPQLCLMNTQSHKCFSPVTPTTPGTGQTTPGTGQTTPGTGQTTPGTGQTTPGTGQTTPGTGHTTPGTGHTTPGTNQTTLGTGQTTPGTGQTTPGTGQTTPGTGHTTPGTNQTTPGTGQTTPGTGQTTPGTGQTTPGTGQTTPGTGQTTPGTGQTTPGTGQTTPRTSQTTATTPPIAPTTSGPCKRNRCEHNGICKEDKENDDGWMCECLKIYTGKMCQYYDGEDVVVIVIEMTLDEFNETAFYIIIAQMLNEACADGSCVDETSSTERIVKRAAQTRVFKPEDIVLAGEPKAVGDQLEIKFAVVVKAEDGASPVRIPKSKLAKIVDDSSEKIGQSLGHKVTGVYEERQQVVATKPPSTSADTGLIAGIVVAILIIVLIAGLAIWYFRVRKLPVSYQRDVSSPTQITFENPGYSTPEFPQLEIDVPPVQFQDVYPDNITGASNPAYDAIGMGVLQGDKATSKLTKPKLEFDMSEEEKNDQDVQENAIPPVDENHKYEQIPKKKAKENVYETPAPVAESAVKSESVKVAINPDSDPQLEEAHYASLQESTRVKPDEEKPSDTTLTMNITDEYGDSVA